MTPVFCCGLECGGIGHVTTSGTAKSIVTALKRTGTYALRCNPTASTGSNFLTAYNSFLSSNIWVARFYVRFATLPNTNAHLATVGASETVLLFNASDGKLYAKSKTTVGATGISVTTNTWYRVDLKVYMAGDPWTTDLSVDGAAAGQASEAGANTSSDDFKMGLFATGVALTADAYFDDLLISYTLGDFPLGAGHVDAFVPTSDGTHNVAGAADFKHGASGADITNATTDAYTLVDDVPIPSGVPVSTDLINAIAPPNATDYVECVFGPAPGFSTPTVAPLAVECMIATHQAGTQTGSYKVNLNDNGTMGLVFEQAGVSGATSFKWQRKHFATAPTGGAWTVAAGNGNFNDIRFRFYSADAAPDQYLDAIMIEADFAETVNARRVYVT